MTGGVNIQHNTRIRASAVAVAHRSPNRPIGHADHRKIAKRARRERLSPKKGLDSWGGVILVAENSGGVAGESSNGKCQSKGLPQAPSGGKLVIVAVSTGLAAK